MIDKNKIINAFEDKWESFTRFIKIYLKNNSKIKDSDKKHLKVIARRLDEVGNKAFVLDKYQLEKLISYNANSIKHFFSIPIISDYVSDYEKEVLKINLRKKLDKLDKKEFSKEDIQSLQAISKILNKYIQISKPHTFVAVYLPPIKYEDLRLK